MRERERKREKERERERCKDLLSSFERKAVRMMTRTIENRKPKTMGRTRELAASRAQQPPGTAGNATNHKTMRHKEKVKRGALKFARGLVAGGLPNKSNN